jgi:hypothetical protein
MISLVIRCAISLFGHCDVTECVSEHKADPDLAKGLLVRHGAAMLARRL